MPPVARYLFLFFAFFFACSQPTNTPLLEPNVEVDLALIKKRGYITALVDNNSFSYLIYKGRAIGYEYELLRMLAKELKVDLKIKIISGVENGIHQLNSGEGDILAFPLTVTDERTRYVSFSRPLFNSYQVLVQRKPENWRELQQAQVDTSVIRDPHQLINQEVHVMKSSSFAERMRVLSQEVGGEIRIVEDSANAESESLIKQVALGTINYTVADHPIAMVNANYYPNLDVNTVLSKPQQIAWSVRKNSPELLNAINTWLIKIKKAPTFMVVYNRYFKSPRTSLLRVNSDYSSLGGNKISRYDDLIKSGAKKLDWDWRLLAAIIYHESRFISNDESWAGARGLMQLMPETARRFGARNPDDPRQSIHAGVNYLRHLDQFWIRKEISDSNERLKFILASYNAGVSHIMDARKLARKHGKNPAVWDDVEFYLLKKSDRAFYRDPVVTAGYCKCEEPVNYVKNVLRSFEEYKLHITA